VVLSGPLGARRVVRVLEIFVLDCIDDVDSGDIWSFGCKVSCGGVGDV
jgi:hypothetical protein